MNQIINKPSLESLLDNKDFKDMLNAVAYTALRSSYRFSQSHPIISKQDLVSEGIAAACSAYRNFDPAKGAWCSYVYMYIKNAMQTFCKKFCHSLSISEKESREYLGDMTKIGVTRIDAPLSDDQQSSDYLLPPSASGVDIHADDLDEFYLRGFQPIEITMFKEHLLEDRTLQDIANRHGVTKSTVNTTINMMYARIKERIEYYESQNRD